MDKPAASARALHALGLAQAHLQRERAAGLQQTRQRGDDGAVGVEAIRAAIEREARLEARDFRRKRIDVVGADVGRIGDDEIELAVECSTPNRS